MKDGMVIENFIILFCMYQCISQY